MSNSAQQCADLIRNAKSIAVLTGAGISTSAGIPDFRGPQGLYVTKRYDPEKVFEIGYFYKDQKPFFEFALDFLELETKIKPTFTHKFLAQLEKQEKLIGIVTQNIDSLHQLAGSKKVLEMHGSFWKSYCLDCDKLYPFEKMRVKIKAEGVPHCECGGVIKPDIVFFGENVNHLHESFRLAHQSDVFFVIGSSCVVFPAGSVPLYANGDIVIVNKGKVDLDMPNVVLEVEEDCDLFFYEVAKCLEQ